MESSAENSQRAIAEPARPRTNPAESGQVIVSLLLMLSLFLLAMVGFAVDFTNLWFRRQAAQSAADSACQAGAMDMSAVATGLLMPNMGFTPGTSGSCSGNSGAGSICFYANANGYSGLGLSSGASNAVAWSFPQSVTGVTAPPNSITEYPFLKVSVTENVPTHFLFLTQRSGYQQVTASCTCGLVQKKEAAPMIVLSPSTAGAFTYQGRAMLTIVGGPQRSLQVNSTSSTAIAWSGSAVIDTSKGGPNWTGSDVATSGGPGTAPGGGAFNGGTTGGWHGSVLPIGDPYAAVAEPVQPALSPTADEAHVVAYGYDGCPDHSPKNYYHDQTPHSGCLEFEPGYYPDGVNLNGQDVAIFKPGIYYMGGTLNIGGSDEVRPATPCKPACSPYSTNPWQQTDGVMFYFLNGDFDVSGGSGTMLSSRVDPLPSTALSCDGSSPNPALGMPSTLDGNILVAQCTQNGTYWDTNNDTTDSRGNPGSRGLLVFQGHANANSSCGGGGGNGVAGFTGSGTLAFSGALYFHSTGYADQFCVRGTSTNLTYAIGQIVADQVTMTGSGAVRLALSSTPSTEMLKVAMLQ